MAGPLYPGGPNNGPANGADHAAKVAFSPSGRVYVTGTSDSGPSRLNDYATIAYKGGTGALVWVARYNGPASRTDGASSVAVSPRDTQVFVIGSSYGGTTTRDEYATIAYRTATGARLWASRYNGEANSIDSASSVAVSPDGTKVIVTGDIYTTIQGSSYGTIAYSS